MSKPQGKCIFCDGIGLSKEHIWSTWLRQYLPRRYHEHYRGSLDFHSGSATQPNENSWRQKQGDVATLQVRCVCRTCNNGWMSQIDENAKAHLTPLICGQAIVLDDTAQRLIATWVALKFMIVEQVYDRAVTLETERSQFRDERTPPGNWRIWIAQYASEAARNSLVRVPVAVPLRHGPCPEFNTQFLTFVVGRLLILAIAAPDGFSLALPPEASHVFRSVHPTAGKIVWPPFGSVTDAELLQFTRGQLDMLRALQFQSNVDENVLLEVSSP